MSLSLAACSLSLCVDFVVLTFAAGLVTFSLGHTCKLPLLRQAKQVAWIALSLSEAYDSSIGHIGLTRHEWIRSECTIASAHRRLVLVSQPSRGQGQAMLSCSIPDARSLRGSKDIAAALTDEYARKDAKVWRHALDRLVTEKTLLHLVNNTLAAVAGL